MKIVKCTARELDAVCGLYDRAEEYLEKHINYPRWTRGVYPGRESVSAAAAAGAQYACMDGETAAGAFVLNADPQGDYGAGAWGKELKEGEYLVIHAFATAPELYGRGVGKKMAQYCINKAREEGFGAIRLDVVPDNFPARRLYESVGFSFAGERDLGRGIEDIPLFALYELNF